LFDDNIVQLLLEFNNNVENNLLNISEIDYFNRVCNLFNNEINIINNFNNNYNIIPTDLSLNILDISTTTDLSNNIILYTYTINNSTYNINIITDNNYITSRDNIIIIKLDNINHIKNPISINVEIIKNFISYLLKKY
jgi:hypothetical protein